jgi:hypothetical protein
MTKYYVLMECRETSKLKRQEPKMTGMESHLSFIMNKSH